MVRCHNIRNWEVLTTLEAGYLNAVKNFRGGLTCGKKWGFKYDTMLVDSGL
jgi:hypothetical protein